MSKLNVLYQSNDGYSVITATSICSLLENNKDIEDLNIYILNNNISKENQKKFIEMCGNYKRKVTFIDVEPYLKSVKQYNLIPYKNDYTTYFKLFLFNDIKTNNDKLLYIDGDTIINSSLRELAERNIEDDVVLGTYDCIPNYYKKLIGIPENEPYYNAGVLYVNQKKWREEGYDKIIKNHLKNVNNNFNLADQDILNCLFRNNITYLDLGYNFNSGFYIYGIDGTFKLYDLDNTCFHDKKLIKERMETKIIDHCMGAMTGRPWEKDNNHPINNEFNHYLSLTPWKDYKKKKAKISKIFAIQKLMFEKLPINFYITIHKIVQKNFYAKQIKAIKNRK